MGQPLGGGVDTANPLSVGTLGAVGTSPPVVLYGSFNISLWGTFSGSVQLERSFDGGVTWLPVSASSGGTVLAWTAPVSLTWPEIEHQVLYHLNCTALTAGTVNFRLSQSSDLAFIGGLGR